MVKLFVQNTKRNNQPNEINLNSQKKGQIQPSLYKGSLYGALFGVGAGICDGFATTFYAKKDLKKTLETFKNASFADKKLMVKNLLDNGKTIKEFKQYAKKISNSSPFKLMLKRGLIYGGIISAAGFICDLGRQHSAKSK